MGRTVRAVAVVAAAIRGNHFQRELDRTGLTQKELARRVGLSYRHTNRLYLGLVEPTLLQAARFGTVLRVPLYRLFDVVVKTKKLAAKRRGNG